MRQCDITPEYRLVRLSCSHISNDACDGKPRSRAQRCQRPAWKGVCRGWLPLGWLRRSTGALVHDWSQHGRGEPTAHPAPLATRKSSWSWAKKPMFRRSAHLLGSPGRHAVRARTGCPCGGRSGTGAEPPRANRRGCHPRSSTSTEDKLGRSGGASSRGGLRGSGRAARSGGPGPGRCSVLVPDYDWGARGTAGTSQDGRPVGVPDDGIRLNGA